MKSGAQSLLTRVIFVVIVIVIVASYVVVDLKKCEVAHICHGLVFKPNELGSIDQALYDGTIAIVTLIIMELTVAIHAGTTTSRIPALIVAVTDLITPKFIARLEKSRGNIMGATYEASGSPHVECRFQWLQEFVPDIELVYIPANRTYSVPANSIEIVATEKHYKTQM